MLNYSLMSFAPFMVATIWTIFFALNIIYSILLEYTNIEYKANECDYINRLTKQLISTVILRSFTVKGVSATVVCEILTMIFVSWVTRKGEIGESTAKLINASDIGIKFRFSSVHTHRA
ncbi:unnamed protein product, partial [Medioppia subpectinata]